MHILPAFLLLALVASFPFHVLSQCPPSGSYTATTQAEVDAFANFYPNCTELFDKLSLNSSSSDDPIVDLSPFENLTYGGDLSMNNLDALTDLTGLGGLLELRGLVIAGCSELTSLEGFQNLAIIEETIFIASCENLASLDGLEGVTSVATIVFNGCDALSDFSALQNLQSEFSIYLNVVSPDADLSSLPSQSACGGLAMSSLNAQSLDELPTNFHFADSAFISLFDLSEMTEIGGPEFPENMNSINIRECPNLIDLPEFSTVATARSINLQANSQITDLQGFNNLTSLQRLDLFSMTALTALPASFNTLAGLEHLQFGSNPQLVIGEAFSTTTSLEELYISDQDPDFVTELSQINSVGKLEIANYLATDLTAFDYIEQLDELSVGFSDSLSSLNGIFLGAGDSLNSLSIRLLSVVTSLEGLPPLAIGAEVAIAANAQLSQCSVENICGGFPFGDMSVVANNASGCNSPEDLIANCNFNQLDVSVFYDANGNTAREVDEPYLNNFPVHLTGNNVNQTFFTGEESGTFTYFFAPDVIELTVEDPWLDFFPASEIINATEQGGAYNVDFAVTVPEDFGDFSVGFFPTIQARPGFVAYYQMNLNNHSNLDFAGELTLSFDPDLINLNSSDWPPTTSEPGMLTWDISAFPAFGNQSFNLAFNVNQPPTVLGGDILTFTATAIPDENLPADLNPDDNTITLDQTVVNSYDPNDKQVNKGEEILLEEVGDYFHYLIRFQNTGTASAINVRIEDTLSTLLDWSTFEPLTYSHAVGRTTINENGEVAFIFDNIQLPDSLSDPEGSQGYVSFRIRSNDDLQLGDVVENIAHIYFDFNAAIITNTTITRVVEPSNLNEITTRLLSVFPNPAEDLLTLNGLATDDNVEEIIIYDHLGREVTHSELMGRQLNVSELSPGFYHLRIELVGGETGVAKFIKQ